MYGNLTVDLKKKLHELGVNDLSGKKSDLINRILGQSKDKKRKFSDESKNGDRKTYDTEKVKTVVKIEDTKKKPPKKIKRAE